MVTFFLSNILIYAQTSEGIYSIHNFKDNGWESYQVFTITLDKKNGKLNAKKRNRDGEPKESIFKEVEIVSGEELHNHHQNLCTRCPRCEGSEDTQSQFC